MKKIRECVCCRASSTDFKKKLRRLSCGHRFCSACIKRVFRLSLKDSLFMPPKCCGQYPIPLEFAEPLFSRRFKVKWNEQLIRVERRDWICCPFPQCGGKVSPDPKDGAFEWVYPSGSRRGGFCLKCWESTCLKCGAAWHDGYCLQKDFCLNEDRLRVLASSEGWRECPGCHIFVERTEGCNHMTW